MQRDRSVRPDGHTDVLVVGASPSGLTAAVLAARQGARVRVVDAGPGPLDEPRLAIVRTPTLELLDKLGLADDAIRGGQRLTATRSCTRGRIGTDTPMPGAAARRTPFPFALACERGDVRELLADQLGAVIGTTTPVGWGSALTGLHQDHDGVTAEVRRADGRVERITAYWLVAADGARSTARELLGVPFQGVVCNRVAFSADVDLDADFALPAHRLGTAGTSAGHIGIVRLHAGGHSPYRLFGTVAARLSTASEARRSEIGAAELQRWFDKRFRLPARITRCSRYRVHRLHRRTAPRFRLGRCFLVGDAAHVQPPSRGRGADLDVDDGYDLGWKLGTVATGRAREELLDTYDAERRPSAAHSWTAHPDGPGAGGRPTGRARPGDRAPDAMVFRGTRAHHLLDDLRGAGHHLLVLEGVEPRQGFAAAADRARRTVAGFPLRCRVHVLASGQDDAHAAYAVTAPCVVLVRPDGLVAHRGPLDDLAALDAHLDAWHPRSGGDSPADGLPGPGGPGAPWLFAVADADDGDRGRRPTAWG